MPNTAENWLDELFTPRVVDYTPEEHEPLLREWLTEWKIGVEDMCLSPVGVVVDGVAIGFLVQTDAGQSYLDRFITKPGISKEERASALAELVRALEAKASPGTWLSALVSNEGLSETFSDAGYKPMGQFVLFTKREEV